MSITTLPVIQGEFRDFLFESCGEHLRVKVNPGRDTRIPLLICGGFGIRLDVLDDLVKAMGGITVIRFDPPGLGGSRNRYLPYRFSHMAEVLDQLLAHLGYEQVDMLGISWGGMLAQEFVLRYPQRCRKLVLASTLAGAISVPGNTLLRAISKPHKWMVGRKYSRVAALLYGGKVLKKDWRRLERFLALYGMDLPGYFGQVSAALGWTSITRLNSISLPVLLLYGTDDAVIPLINARLIKKMIPHARLVTFDAGHLFPLIYCDRVCEEISKFRSEDHAAEQPQRCPAPQEA